MLMGFEGKISWGAPGTTAPTELTIARDVNYKFDSAQGDTSDRGSIIDYSRVAGVKFSLELEVRNKPTDAFIAAVRAAVIAGTPMAFRTRDKASGWGVDGDFNIGLDESQPLRDRQSIKISATPNNENRSLTWS